MFESQYSSIANMVWYQSVWLIAIIGQHQVEWVLPFLLALHLSCSADRINELKLMASVTVIGSLLDSILTLSGVFVFADADVHSFLPIPLWLVVIWAGFAGVLRHSMSFLLRRPVLASVAGAVGAPCSYLAGQRLGAVSFGYDSLTTAIIIGLCWACLLPALLWFCRRFCMPEYASMGVAMAPQLVGKAS